MKIKIMCFPKRVVIKIFLKNGNLWKKNCYQIIYLILSISTFLLIIFYRDKTPYKPLNERNLKIVSITDNQNLDDNMEITLIQPDNDIKKLIPYIGSVMAYKKKY